MTHFYNSKVAEDKRMETSLPKGESFGLGKHEIVKDDRD